MNLFIRTSFVAMAALSAGSALAQSFTVATFADPTTGDVSPMFQRNGGLFTGGWSNAGLILQTPGTGAPDFANATFTMTPLVIGPDFGAFAALSGGTIVFNDSSANMILTITFTSANLLNTLSFGGSDFVANNVTFTGPAVTGMGLISGEAFSFSFANPAVADLTHWTVTSSFTSSAVPTPGCATLLGIGGLMAGRRRRA